VMGGCLNKPLIKCKTFLELCELCKI